ncbi:serine/threonine-protein kinase [Gloeobacter morelensis]|uniref:Serine/threonine protein kinase n=1 Tax=Gloeobacter morelensis MG652769 TaxID=2781736 RepID=A0ABY3PHX9_9CYAN|nr:serine/threonine-protein kinase [Gloeobacter morelensis]UFP93285.1 serine/threonine protein kinase [Gloeobacter morelensis MG652769]
MESSIQPISIGALIDGRYRLTRYIDGGGMGKVYEAVDTCLGDKPVAVKLLQQNFNVDDQLFEQLRRRFEQEAQLCALLGGQHGIIAVSDYGLDGPQPYLVMEYLGAAPRGRSLKELVSTEGPLSPERTVRLAVQICESLQYAHGVRTHLGGRQITGVVHRDIKPSNIFVIDRALVGETTKVLDFGIAKAVSDVTIAMGTNMGFVGTCDYASPEQLRGEELDARSDIYSLGIVLYQMLTGQLPLQPKTHSFAGWYQAHNHESPVPLPRLAGGQAIPPRVAAVVMACLEKEPARRPTSMQELSQRLQDGLFKTAPEPVAPERKAPPPASDEALGAALAAAWPVLRERMERWRSQALDRLEKLPGRIRLGVGLLAAALALKMGRRKCDD